MARVGGPVPLLVGVGGGGGEDCSLSCERGLAALLSAGVFSLAGLRWRGVLWLPLVDFRPRLRARLGGRVDPPHLPLLVLLSLGGEP